MTEYLLYKAEFIQVKGGSGIKTRYTKITSDDNRAYFRYVNYDLVYPLFTSHAIYEDTDNNILTLAVAFQESTLIKVNLKEYHELKAEKGDI